MYKESSTFRNQHWDVGVTTGLPQHPSLAQEVEDNAFRIAGGVAGKKVSWEVTAVRNDPYMRDHPVRNDGC